MIIVYGRPVQFGKFMRTPIAHHVPEGTQWRDTLSHDGQLIMSEIDDELSPEIVAQINDDGDVFDVIDLDPAGGQSNGKRRDRKKVLSSEGRANGRAAARRRGIPDELIVEAVTVDDTADVFRREMYLDQALGGTDLDEPRRVAQGIRDKLARGGFEFDYRAGDTVDQSRSKALRKEARRGGR